MRALAEFVMKGSKQATIAVVVLGVFPLLNLLSPVVVGLVMLRKGSQEAGLLLVWAIIPIAGWAMVGQFVPLFMLLGVSAMAYLLRVTESWEFTLLAAIAVGIGVEIYLRIDPTLLDAIFVYVEDYLSTNNLQGVQLEDLRETFTSLIGVVYMFQAILLLMLARWMQAALYNPGGFQKEFHGVRIEQKVALILVGLMILANLIDPIPVNWWLYLVSPLVFAGVALIHSVIAEKKLSAMWLVAFYLLIALPLVLQLVVLLALIDSWYDFRARLKRSV